MPLMLPSLPGPRSALMRALSSRAELKPAFGNAVQRLNRKGSCYALEVEMPPLSYGEALAWSDLEDETETVVMEIPQPGVNTGAPGLPVVNGAGQSGKALLLRSVTPGYAFGKGWYLSLITGGERFVYRARARAVAAADGTLTIPLRTMLREPHGDGDVAELARPMIEGFARFDGAPVEVTHNVEISFVIEERG